MSRPRSRADRAHSADRAHTADHAHATDRAHPADRGDRNGRNSMLARRTGRGAWWAVFMGALLIVGLSWLVSLQPANSPFLVASSLLFALAEGIVLAFVAALWSRR